MMRQDAYSGAWDADHGPLAVQRNMRRVDSETVTIGQADGADFGPPAVVDFLDGPFQFHAFTIPADLGRKHVDAGLVRVKGLPAEELRDARRARGFEQITRGSRLRNLAVKEQRHAVRQDGGFLLVVSNEHGSDAELALEGADKPAHLFAQMLVEGGEGLVQQEYSRLGDKGAGEGNALLLASGKLIGAALFEAGHPDHLERPGDTARGLTGGQALHSRAEGNVVEDGHVGKEQRALKHHGRAAFFRRDMVDRFTSQMDGAFPDGEQAGNGFEGGGFAASGRPEKGEEFPACGGEGDPPQHGSRSVPGADAAQFEAHWRSTFSIHSFSKRSR